MTEENDAASHNGNKYKERNFALHCRTVTDF